jgi:CRP/FNR family cyclic AMP-dependent transcriptional regulator
MPPKTRRPFDAEAFLNAPGVAPRVAAYAPAATIFAQGDVARTVLYIQQGRVKLSVVSRTGKEAVVGVLSAGDFFGEGALAGQPVRLATATAMSATRTLVIPKRQMIRLLHQQHALSDRFIAYMLARNTRLEEDLVDQLFNASEKRLARTLLLLARYGRPDGPRQVLPKISQEVLAEMVGTTRSRVNFFMNKFRKLGFIEYNGGLKVHRALLSVVLHDAPSPDH